MNKLLRTKIIKINDIRGLSKSIGSRCNKTSIVELKSQFKKRLELAKEESLLGGGSKRIDTQHSRGKLTARERLELLLDEGSFREYDQLKTHRCVEFGMEKEKYYGDGVITGHGLIQGRKVQDKMLFVESSNDCFSNIGLRF